MLIEPIFYSGKWQAGTTKKRLVQENEQEQQNEWYVKTNGNRYCPNKWLHVNGNKWVIQSFETIQFMSKTNKIWYTISSFT